jgi:hypothetical protein
MGSILSSLITVLVFAAIGWLAFRKSAAPRKPWVWLVLLLATLLVGYVGESTKLLSAPGFEIYFNDCLQGLGFGMLAGLLVKK